MSAIEFQFSFLDTSRFPFRRAARALVAQQLYILP
jgi:hypothetical protein